MNLYEAQKILKSAGCRLLKERTSTTEKAGLCLKRLLNDAGGKYKPHDSREYECTIGVTKEEIDEIEKILPGFTDMFDMEYACAGGDINFVEIGVDYWGETDPWGGHDPGSAGEETEVDQDDVNTAVRKTLDMWLEENPDYYIEAFGIDEDEFNEKLDVIYDIIVNRSDTDTVDVIHNY